MKTIEKLLAFIALWALAIFNEFFAVSLAHKLQISDSIMFFSAVVIISIIVFIFLHYRKKYSVEIHTYVLKEEHEKAEKAQRGLVLLLTPLNSFNSLQVYKSENPEKYEKAIIEMDLDVLNLEDTSRSNYGHLITALKAHQTMLEHVWLICSRSKLDLTVQSLNYAPLMEKFIIERINKKIKVHYGLEYSVLLDDDSSVCRASFDLTKKIYKEAKKLKIKTKEIITDATGGTKSISTGVILACLNKDENIQLIGTAYDDNGKPKGEPYPVVIQYAPFTLDEN